MFLIPELLYSIFTLIKLFCNRYLKISLLFYFSDNLIKYTLKCQFFFFSISHFFLSFLSLSPYTEYYLDTSSSSFLVSTYFKAFSLCSFSGITWTSSSFIISSILSILSCVLFSFFSASSFLFLYLKVQQVF